MQDVSGTEEAKRCSMIGRDIDYFEPPAKDDMMLEKLGEKEEDLDGQLADQQEYDEYLYELMYERE